MNFPERTLNIRHMPEQVDTVQLSSSPPESQSQPYRQYPVSMNLKDL